MKIEDIKGLSSLSSCERKLDLKKADGLRYYQLVLADGTHISIFYYAPAESKPGLRLAVGMPGHTEPTSQQAKGHRALVAVNGGYFNLSDGVSASYVTVGGAQAADPKNNQALVQNPKLKPFLPAIFNRSELRIMQDGQGHFHYSIAAHSDPYPEGLKLVDALQGGPRLLPQMRGAEEAFLRTEEGGTQADSIGVKRTAARTAIGLLDGDGFILICVAGKKQDEFSAGLTLYDLAHLFANLGAREALNFDGGTSTTMVLEGRALGASQAYSMLVGRQPETRVRSTLCLIEQGK